MARYKVLKNVAHNVGHSFVSLMNYASDDYVMGHILRLGRITGRDTLTINLMDGTGGPPELIEPISDVPAWYSKMFWRLVKSQGSDPSLVGSATLTVHYDLSKTRTAPRDPEIVSSPFKCALRIVDTRGKESVAYFDGWWAPEQFSSNSIAGEKKLTLRQKLVAQVRKWLRAKSVGRSNAPTDGR